MRLHLPLANEGLQAGMAGQLTAGDPGAV